MKLHRPLRDVLYCLSPVPYKGTHGTCQPTATDRLHNVICTTDRVFMAQMHCRKKREEDNVIKEDSPENPFLLQVRAASPPSILPPQPPGAITPVSRSPKPHRPRQLTLPSGFARREKIIRLQKVPAFCPKGAVLVNSGKG